MTHTFTFWAQPRYVIVNTLNTRTACRPSSPPPPMRKLGLSSPYKISFQNDLTLLNQISQIENENRFCDCFCALSARAGGTTPNSPSRCVCVEKYRWMLAGAKILFFFVERREMVFMRNVRM
uniref:(northern house mosquito) hypothetical protein n=1 Tax=Culex pipiens TaxID=7175 RepID=A0A8D8FGA9_CULPI